MINLRAAKALTVKSAFFRKGVITIGILITGLFSAVLAILAWFGANTGNFIVMIDRDEFRRGIFLSTDENFVKPEPRLYAASIGEVDNISYADINRNLVKETPGSYIDPEFSYLAFTYYLKNTGDTAVDIKYRIYITENYRSADAAVRVLLIEDDETERLFQKPDTVEHQYLAMPEALYFVDDITVCEDTILAFPPGAVKKFSVIIWLEGQDPDCNDSLLGGMIKLRMKFDIADDEEAEE